jgi:hypothetical protein
MLQKRNCIQLNFLEKQCCKKPPSTALLLEKQCCKKGIASCILFWKISVAKDISGYLQKGIYAKLYLAFKEENN